MHFSNWHNKTTIIWLCIVTVVAIVLGMQWYKGNLHVQTNLFKLLPDISAQPDVLDSYAKVSQNLNNNVFIMLQTDDHAQLDQSTAWLEAQVTQTDLWQPIKKTFQQEQFSKTLFQYQTGLLSQQDRELLQQHQYPALLEQSMLQLMSPGMPITAEMLAKDPLLLFPRYLLEKSSGNSSQIAIEQGWATVEQADNSLQANSTQSESAQTDATQSYSRLVVLQVAHSPYQIDYQEQSKAWLDHVEQQLQQQKVAMNWTGTLAFASEGTQSARQEISTIGVGSTIGLIVLVLFGFRSIRPLFTEFIAIGSGLIMAIALTHLIFGEIHLMTLVFGASLIGVCVDFSFYFMAIQSVRRDESGLVVLRPILSGLFIGLMTTLLAYLFLSFTPFPAFKQISVFSIVGLSAAWISSVLLLPRLPPLNTQFAVNVLRPIAMMRAFFMQRNTARYALIIVAIAFSAMGLTQLKFNDDMQNLQSMDASLKQNDRLIRQTFAEEQAQDFLIVHVDDKAKLAQAEQTVISKLDQLLSDGKISAYQAIGQWFDPATIQQNIQLLQQIPETDLVAYAEQMGLDSAQVLAWKRDLASQPTLTMTQFQQHPLASLAISDKTRVILLQGVQDDQAIHALENQQVYFMQPVQTLSDQFQEHRQHAQYLLLIAMLALVAVLWWLYGHRALLDLMLPVTLALGCTFALQALLGVELNLFSIMATFLILGIGVDYAIFYHDAAAQDQVISMALWLCMMSTLLGFGLLSLSQTYAIFCFGLTVLCGVLLSYFFASCLTRPCQHKQLEQRINEAR